MEESPDDLSCVLTSIGVEVESDPAPTIFLDDTIHINPLDPQLLPTDMPTLVHGFSDGGYLEDTRMAAGWWLSSNDVVRQAKGEIISWKSPSNNVAEYFGLIRLLETALDRDHNSLAVTMDSLLVVQHMRGLWQCKNHILMELLQYARGLADQFSYFSIQHTLREGNTVADALCNAAFDGFKGTSRDWLESVDKPAALREVQLSEERWTIEDFTTDWKEWWSMVMSELQSIGPMLRNRYISDLPDFSAFHPSTQVNSTEAKRSLKPTVHWPYAIEECALREMKLLAEEANIPWDKERFKCLVPTINKHGVAVLPYPHEDARYTTDILAGIDWNLPRLIRAWRGQTESDPRPNKSLDFTRISKSTVGYDQRTALKKIIEDGYGMHWEEPYVGVRPLPKNQPSAEANAEIMGAMILKQYKKGRLMVMIAEEVAEHVPSFATSPYGCVAKANKPLTHTCRPIHNQSAPKGRSINEGLDASLRPDAVWPGASHIADRILTASKAYGANNLKAFITDITDAFLQVGLLDKDAQVNGGLLPQSNIATLATSCVFGNCESPGAFRILNCVPHIHRQSGSVLEGVNTPFDIRFYVDDGNAIEPDIENRLQLAEESLRKTVTDVFGPGSIQEEKTSSWSSSFTSLGYCWDLPSGTVSIPADKLLRVKNELMRFSTLRKASVNEFRSLVGKLRHVTTCCKPAGALMALLGSGLSCHKVTSGKQQRIITETMKKELSWWSTFLTPERFHNLPVEWLGKRENKISNWLHCYSELGVGVWLVNQKSGSMRFTPWKHSLLVTTLICLQASLDNHVPSTRMSHTRIIINECHIAKVVNQGSSPDQSIQDLLKSIGLWQLDHRHRITATTPIWEQSPPLSLSPCSYHTNTNLFLQISCHQSMEKSSPPSLQLGRLQELPRALKRSISDILGIGSCSVRPSIYPAFGLMNSFQENKPWLWHGLPSTVDIVETTKSKKAINMELTSIKRPQSSGHINTTVMPFFTSKVQPSSWWKLPIRGQRITHGRKSHALPVCCSMSKRSSELPLEGHSHGVSSSSNISFSEEEGSFGQPTTHVMDWNKHNAIIGFNGMTSSYKTEQVMQSTGANQNLSTRYRSPSTMPRQIKREGEMSLLSEHQATQCSVLYEEQSLPLKAEARGKPARPPTPSLEALKRLTSLNSSNEQERKKVSTPSMSPDTRCASVTPLPYSRLDLTNWSSGLPVGGPARQSPATHASLVGCY